MVARSVRRAALTVVVLLFLTGVLADLPEATLGIAWATIAATLTAFSMFVYPFASFAGLVVEVVILWALLKHADEFEGA